MESWLPTLITLGVVILGMAGILIVIKKSLTNVIELLTVVSTSLEDNKITSEELASITKEFKELIDSFKKKP